MSQKLFAFLITSICAISPANGEELDSQKCDASTPESAPISRYEINQSEGTVLDLKTKLTWKVCAEGQEYANERCEGKPTTFSWLGSMDILDGQEAGWRVPTEDELRGIVEEKCENPAINASVFPNTPTGSFWTSSTDSAKSPKATSVDFYRGVAYSSYKDGTYYLRLVRGQSATPTILRRMDKDSFCVAYGEALRGNVVSGVGSLPAKTMREYVKNEARHRKLKFNDSLTRNSQIKLGATKCQMFASWGLPDEDNETVGRWGVHIQHVYGSGTYVYTENGRITSWQD